jgi:hypothetical protein
MNDALALLKDTVPERIWRFTEALLEDKDMDPRAAAIAAGAPGQHRALMEDRRFLVLFGAMQNDLRATHNTLRHQLVGMLGRMATFDPRKAFAPDGLTLKNVHDIPDDVAAAIESVQIKPSGEMYIKFSKRVDAIKILFALFGDLDSQVAVGGTAKVIFRGREET